MNKSLADLMRTIESENPALTNKSLKSLRTFDFGDDRPAARFLVWLAELTPHLCFCETTITHSLDKCRCPIVLIEIHTHGWPRTEDLMTAILANIWIKPYHLKWIRDGHYTFEIPLAMLRNVEPDRAHKPRDPEIHNATTRMAKRPSATGRRAVVHSK
ncbi:hypothetical protein RZS28_19830 (plasmid) [Methylocapsa polymorpha]|uniref:Transposase n=1 Tax=Methylocapsa polymorpha TaxID=3080828 RepID=A0ABZ0HY33_9HYPH|nr:hypothetical protein [Methylocapsa sp. RX1]WOJ91697.1 hypothetical protein RZS28_19830 [Methylocapsa sp. RX1]